MILAHWTVSRVTVFEVGGGIVDNSELILEIGGNFLEFLL